jgi:hypothetical protein
MMAERKASVSPRKSSEAGLAGKGFVMEGFFPPEPELEVAGYASEVDFPEVVVRSAWETRRMPMKEARTPRSLRRVNFSVRVQAPMRRVQMEEVEVRIVVEATVVNWRQAMAK